MRSPLNLSFRHKVPLWGGLLIVMTTLAVSAALMAQAYEDLKADLLNSSASLSRTLAKPLFTAMLQDDLWRAFEIVRAPLHDEPEESLIQPEMLFALDNQLHVFVSSHPKSVPPLSDLRQAGEEYAQLAAQIAARPEPDAKVINFSGAHHIYVATPISEGRTRLGTLVNVHSKDGFLPHFRNVAFRTVVIGLLVLTILLPINWYWGQRTAVPLVLLARCICDAARDVPQEPHPGTYGYQDEIGQLFEAYGLMVKTLREKVLLEQEIIRSERLAAIGRLSAGVAHEINNPLGGMLVSLNNFKRRGGHDEVTLKCMAMMERGLGQIRETVSALLVEAKVKIRNFGPQDIEDVQTLLTGEANKRSVTVQIDSAIAAPIALPATPTRQILINLLLNAVQASDPSGMVRCTISHSDMKLTIETQNAGRTIPPEVMSHLFEPFISGNDAGSGLGLWVTYQIVTQLGGQITAASSDGLTRLSVLVPTGEES